MTRLDFGDIPIVDNHLHPPLRAAASPGEGDFRRLFTESDFPDQLTHVESALAFQRAVADLGRLLGLENAAWPAVRDARYRLGGEAWYRRCLEGANVRGLLVDYGYSTGEGLDHSELTSLAESAGARVWPVYRLETALQAMLPAASSFADLTDRFRAELADLRARGYVALKSIIAYRTGLAIEPPDRAAAAAAFARASEQAKRAGTIRLAAKPLLDYLLHQALESAAEQELPLHFHTGFGDRDLYLPDVDPARLRRILEEPRYRAAPIVLLHCYPYVRQAGYLAHVYPNVYVDLSLTVPLIGYRVATAYAEALELAPASKVLYGSDAFSAPDLLYLAATWTRRALAHLFASWIDRDGLTEQFAQRAAAQILGGNTLTLHRQGPA